MQQEELVGLFTRSLTLSAPASASFTEPPTQQSEEQGAITQPIAYATQHYHHSAHVASNSSNSVASRHTNQSGLAAVLSRNGIEPASLSPAQINLFQNADDDQRLRLLELWRIAPPSHADSDVAKQIGTWQQTSLQQEEATAKLRYERQMQAQQPRPQIPPPTQTMEGTEKPPANVALPNSPGNAEPYILSGYETLAQRDYEHEAKLLQSTTWHNQATDPVYKASGMWEKQRIQEMENQYGAYEQMGMLRASQAHLQPLVGLHSLDEDMVM